ncbi:hypothetical protein SYN63AY4M2_08895 [Synechococcus sp. 63AY4M2]|uniref:hypothetical protein n=1 Tax=Synechococcus sp. 63AY4M2 TaxID=1353266 RepID=UPI000C3F586B|nr:hypothetical protein [Synechococcus sp. 63AY4M2]PIK86536.1 hypothetical protein SYN63AY4M2_08895 [Synechococcus sp. 63AY4M2]
MNFKGRSLAVLCGVLLLGGCGEVNESPTLPGPVQVDPAAFVSAQEYRFTPGSVLETTSLRLDYVNPRFDNGIPVRTNPLQGSGEARIANVEARILPVNEIPASDLTIDSTLRSSTLAIQIGRTTPLVNITAFGPNDGRLSTQFNIAGLVAISTNPNDQRIRVNTTFRAVREGTVLTLTVRRILVNRNGNQVVLEGDSSLIVPTVGVLFEDGGPGPGGEILAPGSFVNPPPPQGPVTAILQTGSFSASFVVRQRGVAGDGTPEDALALFARLNFRPNQAEIVYRPAQVGTQSVLFAPDPTRPNILPNQLVRIRRLLNGRVQAEFDPANVSTVLNFVQVSPPPRPFPTPIPQLPVAPTPTPTPGDPTAFDYFFSLRTERSTDTLPGSPVEGTNPEPVILQGIVPTTGDFVFRTLAGAQLAGPFNRLDVGGSVQRGNLNLIFDSTTSAERISGQWFIEQEFPTNNLAAREGAILIIRGFFEGTEVRL